MPDSAAVESFGAKILLAVSEETDVRIHRL